MDRLKKAVLELNKIVDLTKRIEKLIEHLEVYVRHNSMETAEKQEKVLVRNIDIILKHLKKISIGMKSDPEFARLVKREQQVFSELERYLIDVVEHPEHLNKDANIIKKLEIMLENIELEEIDKEKTF